MSESLGYPDTQYQPLSATSFQFGPTQGLIYSADTGPLQLDINVLRVFAGCQGVQRLEGHVQSVVTGDRSLEEAMVRRAINKLVASGLLRATDHSQAAPAALRQSATPIDTVAIVTADRAGALAMCLTSLIRQLQRYSHRPQVLIVDGSQSPACRAANRATVAAATRSWGRRIQLLGREQVIDVIAGHGTVDRGLAEFAFAPSAGGLRNIALATTLDQNVLLVDDDVDCDAWLAHGPAAPQVRVVGHSEQRTGTFCTDRAGALFGLSERPGDLIRAHQHLLGGTLATVASDDATQTDCRMACVHETDAIMTGRPMKTLMTFAGLAGDSGMPYPDRLLFATGRLRHDLSADEASYDRAMRYREGRRIADSYIVTHDTGCMAYCMGLVNRGDLPAFSPVGRNQDGLFGLMVGLAAPDALCGHIPVGIRHRSDRGPEYPHHRWYPSARGTTLTGSMMALLRDSMSPIWPIGTEARLKRMTQILADIGSLNAADFKEVVYRGVLNVRCRELAYIAKCTSSVSDLPQFWQRDLREYEKVLLDSLKEPGFCAAIECAGDSAEASFASMGRFVERFAHLLDAWPDIRRTGVDLLRLSAVSDASRASLAGGASPC